MNNPELEVLKKEGFTLFYKGAHLLEWRKGNIIVGRVAGYEKPYWISYKDEAEPTVKRHRALKFALKRYKH